ncbi:MAG: metallophosphoesterase [Candidatus Micrarchaeaceae archaeon]
MKTLLLADLHFREVPSPWRDRWQETFFEDIQVIAESFCQDKVPVVILGDMTDAKNRHHAKLVNDIVNGFEFWRKRGIVCPYLLWGNHDMVMSGWLEENPDRVPFFKFLIDIGLAHSVEHLSSFPGYPHTVSVYRKRIVPSEKTDVVFFHGPVNKAKTETDYVISGDSSIKLKDLLSYSSLAIGGDIHLPQIIETSFGDQVHYVGSFGHTSVIPFQHFLENRWNYVLRGGLILSDDLETVPVINPRLQIPFSLSLQYSEAETVISEEFLQKVVESSYRFREYLRTTYRAKDKVEEITFRIEVLSPVLKLVSNISPSQAVKFSHNYRTRMEVAIGEAVSRLENAILSSGVTDSVKFQYRYFSVNRDTLPEGSEGASLFRLSVQDRVNALKTAIKDVTPSPFDEEIFKEAFPLFESMYQEEGEKASLKGEEE